MHCHKTPPHNSTQLGSWSSSYRYASKGVCYKPNVHNLTWGVVEMSFATIDEVQCCLFSQSAQMARVLAD